MAITPRRHHEAAVTVALHGSDAGGVAAQTDVDSDPGLGIQKIDLGDTWAGPAHDYPLAGDNVHVPSLDEVLRMFPHDRVRIELKTTGAEASLCSLLRTRRRGVGLRQLRGRWPDQPFQSALLGSRHDGHRCDGGAVPPRRDDACSVVRASGIGQPPLAFRDFHLTKEAVAWDHDHGLADYTWTADTPAQPQAVAKLGVDAV